jgi:hypothetical protein
MKLPKTRCFGDLGFIFFYKPLVVAMLELIGNCYWSMEHMEYKLGSTNYGVRL